MPLPDPASPGRLTGAERRRLRALAHGLQPVVQLGRQGLAEGVVRQIDAALAAHELIKVRLTGSKEEKRQTGGRIEELSGAEMVGLIGHVAIFYRRHPEPDKRKVLLAPQEKG